MQFFLIVGTIKPLLIPGLCEATGNLSLTVSPLNMVLKGWGYL